MFLKVYIIVLIYSIFGDAIDMDYYFSSALRSQSLSCNSHLSQFYCQVKCNVKPALCIQDDCYCINFVPAGESSLEKSVKSTSVQIKKINRKNAIEEFVDFEDLKQPDVHPIGLQSLYALRPTLRHHIAHFCPNLDVARTCIRKCMALGKPAFCGKDHVCYCGHKYTHTGKDKGGDAKALYAQFKDMYEKYFGPGYNEGNLTA